MNFMKTTRSLFRILPILLFGALLGQPVQAQAQLRIGLVNMKTVFDGYWKTKQADAALKEKAQEMDDKRQEMVDDFKKTQDAYQKLLDATNNQALSVSAREDRKKEAEAKLLELREIEQTVQQYDRQARTQLGEQQRRMRDKIIAEIQEVVASQARTAGYNLILNSASTDVTNTPLVLHSDSSLDMTQGVLTQMNQTAPAGTLP